jgi:multiple sugar transport system permease protein
MPLIVGVVKLRSSGETASSWNLMLAGTAISMIPMIVVYIIFNRYFIDGLTSGSIKE